MKEAKVIRNPDAFQLLADDTRLKMIYLLRAKEMTVSQMAEELGLTPQTIYHHIKRLREAEMVDVAREERIDHLVESYFRATAGVFHFVNGDCATNGGSPARITAALKTLGSLGLDVDIKPAGVSKIVKLKEELQAMTEKAEIAEKVYEMDDIDPFTQRDVIQFAVMMDMDDRQFEEYLEAQRALREWLLSQRKDKS